MSDNLSHLHCGYPSQGKYTRLGLKEQGGDPFYGIYGGGGEYKGLSGAWVPHPRMRRQAGDAMFHTLKTMEQFDALFDWWGVTNNCSAPLHYLANELGWTLSEVGRQPWIVYGAMRTADAVSPLATIQVALSAIGFMTVYTLLGIADFYLLFEYPRRGPVEPESAAAVPAGAPAQV